MKTAQKKTVILVNDEAGLGVAISDSLRVSPGSDLSRKQSNIHLSLEKYGVKDAADPCSRIDFVDKSGSHQVTIILLPNFQPPVAACAANEIMELIMSQCTSDPPIILLPIPQASLKFDQDSKKSMMFDGAAAIFGVEVSPATEITEEFLSGTPKPPSFVLKCEVFSCLVLMLQILKLPSLLIGANVDQGGLSASGQDLQEITQIGEYLAKLTRLSFSKESINWREKGKRKSQEPWRALYG
ncbi:period circadian protein [Wolffia australiana]